jgi:peptidoglycan biosynthesis protein MviN/MurJ (putative lipid II flippase)
MNYQELNERNARALDYIRRKAAKKQRESEEQERLTSKRVEFWGWILIAVLIVVILAAPVIMKLWR